MKSESITMSDITTFLKSNLGVMGTFVKFFLLLDILQKLLAFSKSFCNLIVHFDFCNFLFYTLCFLDFFFNFHCWVDGGGGEYFWYVCGMTV